MDKSYQALIRPPLGESLPRADDYMEARHLCAYNQTRGSILGLEIACGDFSFASLAERMPKLTPQSGKGLWLDPFKGIPTTDVSAPLDLIYLDAKYRVIAIVDLFPIYRVSPSTPPAASVLALPTGTLFFSGTQVGDQVAFGLSDEDEQKLARLHSSNVIEFPPREMPAAQREAKAAEAQPEVKQLGKPKNWLQRWLNPDPPEPRKAARAALPDLTVYFWDGGIPKAHEIRDISATGMYVVTDERWYPGTLVQMTLKKIGCNGVKVAATICLMARANRWGNDGVGVGFVVHDPRKPRRDESDGIERADLNRFLAQIKQQKS
jgi:hypothetical protein